MLPVSTVIPVIMAPIAFLFVCFSEEQMSRGRRFHNSRSEQTSWKFPGNSVASQGRGDELSIK